nr:PREDICTED: G-type lectin S-receptor-like serine/threonine-protein kinase At4g27290 [Daucus carota subsp. sativus]
MSSSAADTITANQTITDGQKIVSARGEFEMGFFSYEHSPQNRYFGIWYKKISSGTVIWVANRETAIANTSGVIRVTSRGIVVSSSQSTDNIIWSSNYLRSVDNPVAQLLDSGNLVFVDGNDKENFVWQSFDYPVDNFLPGMKFGYDLESGIDRYFLPYKSDDDPSPGTYIHRIDHNGYPQLILWKDSDVLYRTGPWVGNRFSGNTVLKPNGIYTNRFVITQTEAYYISDLLSSSESAITRLTLTPDGEARRLIWNREKQDWTLILTLQVTDCERYGLCGLNGVCNINTTPRCQCMEGFDPKVPEEWAAADWSNGCSHNVQLECGNGDGFMRSSVYANKGNKSRDKIPIRGTHTISRMNVNARASLEF